MQTYVTTLNVVNVNLTEKYHSEIFKNNKI